MSGTQGSSYSSSKAAAAGNKATTQNLQKGLNASGSSKVSSGLGNKPASSSVNAAAANAARQAAARAATSASQRTATSGYGASRPASANVNAAAARASMMNNQRQAGVTQSYGQGKGDMYGANQTVSKGTNLSAGDMLTGGYMNYKNPSAGLAMAARPNTTVYSKGINQSAADLLQGGYGQYRQAPSMQSTPQTAVGGWNDLAGLQRAVAGMNPSFGSMVAGDQRQIYGGGIPADAQNPSFATDNYVKNWPIAKDMARVPSEPSIADVAKPENYNWGGPPNLAALNANGMNQAFNVNSMPKVAMEGGIPGGISPDSVPSLPNYASPVSVANREPSPYDAQQQVAGYQNPARAFPSRPAAAPTQTAMNSPMAGQGISFSNNRYSMPAAGYNQEIVRALANQRAVSAGLLGNAGTDTFGKYAPGQVAEAPASSADPNATTDYGIYDQQPTRFQKFKASVEKKGDWVNGLLGGTSQNQPGWTPSGNPNARDPLNNLPPKEREKVVTEAGKAATDPEFKALSDGDKTKVLELIKTGMTLKDALKAIKTGTTGGGTQTASQPLYYPQYYSQWAGLPSGQRYA